MPTLVLRVGALDGPPPHGRERDLGVGHGLVPCPGLLAGPSSPAWDTRTALNGRYELCATALDAIGNTGERCAAIRMAN